MRWLFVLASLFGLGLPASAEARYIFQVDSVEFEATIQPDGRVRLHYGIAFTNLAVGQPIDVVDIGMPKPSYSIDSMVAWIDERPLHDIRPSTYVVPGVEVHLGSHAIPSGGQGHFAFEGMVDGLVFSDTTDETLASLQITPTWFGDAYVDGLTDLKIAVHLPEGIHPEQVLHQGVPFRRRALWQDHAVATWHFPDTRFTGPHPVGLSFPRAPMLEGAVIEVTALDLAWMWWAGNPKIRGWIGVVLGLLLMGFFLRFTGGTGWTLILVVLGVGGWFYFAGPRFALFCLLAIPLLCLLMEWTLRRKRKHYLPPILSVEGGGIKRGLTAPEAAALLQVPAGKVLTLVVFGLLKKKVFEQVKSEPLEVEVSEAFRDTSRKKRRKAAGKLGIVLHAYEHDFIAAVSGARGLPLKEIAFGPSMKTLFDHVVDRVTGFDVEETRAYYQYVVSRAWSQAEALGEIEQRTEAVDRDLEWLLLDAGSDDRFGHWRHGGYHYRPGWLRGPTFSVGDLASPASPGSVPSLADVTGSFSGWAEGLASEVSAAVLPGTDGTGGFVDLSAIDRTTGDVFEALAESGGSGGGGGGGCACAGCACACACAGGGR